MYCSSNKRRRTGAQENDRPAKKAKMALYLDDNTPIRTIEASNIGDNTSAEYLRGYFEHAAGRVSDVTFGGRIVEGNRIRVGYITYVLPEDAAVLLDQHLKMEFAIRPADAAHQPKLDPRVLKLDDMPDDCLFHVASLLSLMDLVNLSGTCQRLKSIVERMFQAKTHLSVRGDIASNVPIVLKAIGPHIRFIDWENISKIQLEYLTEHCNNVGTLRLESPSLTSYHIQQNDSFFHNIWSLELAHCPSLYDNSMKIIVNSSNLRKLQLKDCQSMQGKFFNQWKNCRELKDLRIYNCPGVRNAFFHMVGTGQLNSLTRLAVDCKEFGDDDDIQLLKSLPKLRSLTLEMGSQMTGRIYSSLHEHTPRIRRLTIISKGNSEAYSKSIAEMVSSLGHLTYFRHVPVSWDMIYTIRHVREQIKDSPLNIIIPENMFNSPRKTDFDAAFSHVIKLRSL